MEFSSRLTAAFFFTLTVASAWLQPAAAGTAPEGFVLAGAEKSQDDYYAYLGLVTPVGDARLGDGLVQRYWLDRFAYEYVKDNIRYRANGQGVEAALGYQRGSAAGWWAAYGGAALRHIELSPADPTSSADGTRLRFKVQLEGERKISDSVRLIGNSSYLFGQQAYRASGRLAFGSRLLFGPEYTIQGDPDYRMRKAGLFIGGIPIGKAALSVHAGKRRISGRESEGYAGLDFFFQF